MRCASFFLQAQLPVNVLEQPILAVEFNILLAQHSFLHAVVTLAALQASIGEKPLVARSFLLCKLCLYLVTLRVYLFTPIGYLLLGELLAQKRYFLHGGLGIWQYGRRAARQHK